MTEDVYRKNLAVARIDALFDPTISIIIGISYLIGLGYGAYLVFQQAITLGGLVSFNVYLGMLIWPMIAVGELINVMQRGNASLDRVQDTLSYEADVKNSFGLKSIQKPGNIQFNSVYFTYPSSTVVNLSNISVQLERGQTLGIVGKTGSGKTTFVKQLLREYPLGTGEIAFAGMPLEQLNLEDIRKWIGYVPQDHFLFSKSVRENILFGKMDATEEELAEAIRLADFEKDLMMLPNRLETLVGEKGVALSGGQKQRISIARHWSKIQKSLYWMIPYPLWMQKQKRQSSKISKMNVQGKRQSSQPIAYQPFSTRTELSCWTAERSSKRGLMRIYCRRMAGIERNMNDSRLTKGRR